MMLLLLTATLMLHILYSNPILVVSVGITVFQVFCFHSSTKIWENIQNLLEKGIPLETFEKDRTGTSCRLNSSKVGGDSISIGLSQQTVLFYGKLYMASIHILLKITWSQAYCERMLEVLVNVDWQARFTGYFGLGNMSLVFYGISFYGMKSMFNSIGRGIF